MKNIWRGLWRLPLLVGVGALFSYGARASVPHGPGEEAEAGTAQQRGAEVLLKLENDNIYLSQDAGQTFQELELGMSPEVRRLKRLLEHGAVPDGESPVKVGPMLVADGAGGLQWARPKTAKPTDGFDRAQQVTTGERSATTDNARSPAASRRTTPARTE